MEVKLDMSNRELQETMQANVKARDATDEDAKRLLDLFEEVRAPRLVCHDRNEPKIRFTCRRARSGKTSHWKTSSPGRSRRPSRSAPMLRNNFIEQSPTGHDSILIHVFRVATQVLQQH